MLVCIFFLYENIIGKIKIYTRVISYRWHKKQIQIRYRYSQFHVTRTFHLSGDIPAQGTVAATVRRLESPAKTPLLYSPVTSPWDRDRPIITDTPEGSGYRNPN